MAFAARGYGERNAFSGSNEDRVRSVIITACLQGVGIAALLLAPTVIIQEEPDKAIPVINYPPEEVIPPPPTPKKIEPKAKAAKPTTTLTAPDPIIPFDDLDFGKVETPDFSNDFPLINDAGDKAIAGNGADDTGGADIVVVEPVLVAPSFDPRFTKQIQPLYPPGKLRLEIEERVVVRVLVGIDGRAKAIEPVNDADAAFVRSTRRHGLRKWRFKPASRDGKPIEQWMTVTIDFKITQ